MKQSFDGHKQSCSWPLGVINSLCNSGQTKGEKQLNERLLDTSMSLISSLIAYYHCKSVQYGLGGKMSRSNREAHPELS